MGHRVVDQFFVTEVEDDPDVARGGHVGQRGELRFRHQRPRRIARRVEDDPARPWRHRGDEGRRRQRESIFRMCAHNHRGRAGQLDLLGDRRPARRVRDDLVARAEHRLRDIEERLLASSGDNDLGGSEVDAVVGAVAVAHRLFQIGIAGVLRVLREAGVDGRFGRLPDVRRRDEIGLTRAEIDDVHALALQAIGFGRHLQRGRGRHLLHARGEPGRRFRRGLGGVEHNAVAYTGAGGSTRFMLRS